MGQIPTPSALTGSRPTRALLAPRGRQGAGARPISITPTPLGALGTLGRAPPTLTRTSRLASASPARINRHGAPRREATRKPPTRPATGVNTRRLTRRGPKKPPTLLAADQRRRDTRRPFLELGLMLASVSALGAPRPTLEIWGPLVTHPHCVIPSSGILSWVKTHPFGGPHKTRKSYVARRNDTSISISSTRYQESFAL